MKLGLLNFFSDISNFLRSGSVLGVDIGTSSMKVAEISKKGDRFELENYGILETKDYIERPAGALQTSSLKLSESNATELLKLLLREVKPRTKTVVASIPAFISFVTPIEMPAISPEETSKSIKFQAKQYIPIPVSEVSLDWLKVEEFQNDKGERYQRLILIGIPNESINRYKKIFKEAGLKVVSFEVESLALLRSLNKSDEALTLIVDIGAEVTNILVGKKGLLRYSSQTDYGGVYLTQALARSLGVSASRAEELKCRKGLTGKGGEMELSTLLMPFLDVIIQETRHVKDVYERRYNEKIERLYLTGGGANLLGIEGYFGAQVNLPVTSLSPLNGINYKSELEPIARGLNNELLISIGLAKRYFE